MSERHKHADAIIAWAEGAKIEYRDPTRHHSGLWVECQHPGWYENFEYRVKPVKAYRVALFKGPDTFPYTHVADNAHEEGMLEHMVGFIRWLTDWIEYEVE